MARVRYRIECRLDVLPALLVVERSPNRLRDERATPPSPNTPIELGDEIVRETYVQTHGHNIAHRRRGPRGRTVRPSYIRRTPRRRSGRRSRPRDGPRFARGFLNRVWRISGSANGFAEGVLDFTADRFFKLPRRFAKQDDAIVGEDSRVLVSDHTRVWDADHNRLTGDAAAAALDAAEDVVVVGKLLPKAKWLDDEDGTPVPTLRAKKILVQS